MSYYKSDDGVKIYYRLLNKKSNKTPIAFVHGWVCNWTVFEKEIEFFKKKGYPVLYLDVRGHGLSDKPEEKEKYRLDLMSNDLLGILDKEGLDYVNLVGYSMGGMISSLFTYRHEDRLNSLIIIDSSYENPLFSSKLMYFHNHKAFTRHLCDYIINHTSNRHFQNIKKKEIDFSRLRNKNDIRIFLDMILHTPLHSAMSCAEGMFNYNLRNKLHNVKTPTLIISSSKDQLFGNRLEKYFKKQIPHAELIIEEGTHSIVIKKPEEIAEQIDSFLEKVKKHNKAKTGGKLSP